MKKVFLFILIVIISFCGCKNDFKNLGPAVPAFAELKNIDAYSVKGIDISKYQGDIDWHDTSLRDISFAYIKSTQGDGYIDPKYKHNIKSASNVGIKVGSYHFFSFDISGKNQAMHFIENSIYKKGHLPPVLDIEFDNNFSLNNFDYDLARSNIHEALDILQAKYKIKPIIYTNSHTFKLLLSEEFKEYPIWYANYTNNPNIPDGRQWTFWQYSTKGSIKNINNRSCDVDLNVFYGTQEEFEALLN